MLVPVDGSDTAERAVAVGSAFADRYGAPLELVHVQPDRSRIPGSLGAEARERRGREVLADATDRASLAEEAVTTRLETGRPTHRIAERAAECDSSLVVMGQHGRSGVRERLLGTVTDRVLRRTDSPVVTVPGTARDQPVGRYDDILLTTDGSDHAERAAPYGASVARRFGATLHLLSVVDVQAEAGVFDAGGVTESFIDNLERDARGAVDRLAERIDDTDLSIDRTVTRGRPHETIRSYTTEQDVDLVVMASEGESDLASQSLGSVTDRVLRTVDVPVLVVQ
ncbi:MAG: universal stress protein [Halosegnis sp.]